MCGFRGEFFFGFCESFFSLSEDDLDEDVAQVLREGDEEEGEDGGPLGGDGGRRGHTGLPAEVAGGRV